METLSYKSIGNEVLFLQKRLKEWGYSVVANGIFDKSLLLTVKRFQQDQALKVDGIVGKHTWDKLADKNAMALYKYRITKSDIDKAAQKLDIEPAILQALSEVESTKNSGFFSPGKPIILFEGHIFWKELENDGINPLDYLEGNEDILYKRWNKRFYRNGIKEYERFEKASKISLNAAIKSTSWGRYQIMGFNYPLCGMESLMDFFKQMCTHERNQLNLLVNFLISNKLNDTLKKQQWDKFASLYNGSNYMLNDYANKLKKAYYRIRGLNLETL
ncbi:MAG: N-acetylmuramidase family protein [Bacteroidales bacterium]|nr:N-acetylmuramidase family protein [Bacteroidales bacterium]